MLSLRGVCGNVCKAKIHSGGPGARQVLGIMVVSRKLRGPNNAISLPIYLHPDAECAVLGALNRRGLVTGSQHAPLVRPHSTH